MKRTLQNKLLKITILLGIVGSIYVLFTHWNYTLDNPLAKTTQVDELVVYKSKRILELKYNGQKIKTYTVSLGKSPVGDKIVEGDKKTPEGRYYINGKNPSSAYYKNLGISYPNNSDRKRAKQLGKSTGGDVKIHGMRNDMEWWGKCHRFKDWTNGCIAVTNPEMEEIYSVVKMGTPITIYP